MLSNSAWRTLDPTLPAQKSLYPYPASTTSRFFLLIEELGMVGATCSMSMSCKNLNMRLGHSKPDYIIMRERILLRSPPPIKNPLTGFKRLRCGNFFPVFPDSGCRRTVIGGGTIRIPDRKLFWNGKKKKFVMGLPERCSEHGFWGCYAGSVLSCLWRWIAGADKHGSKENALHGQAGVSGHCAVYGRFRSA